VARGSLSTRRVYWEIGQNRQAKVAGDFGEAKTFANRERHIQVPCKNAVLLNKPY
jgi:hypothetical protein